MIEIDEILEELPPEKRVLITRRALHEYGVEFIEEDGRLEVFTDDLSELLADDEFLAIWEHHAKIVALHWIFGKAVAEGLIYTDGVDDDGEIIYRKV